MAVIDHTPEQRAAAELAARIAQQLNELWDRNYPRLAQTKADADAECERRLQKGKG